MTTADRSHPKEPMTGTTDTRLQSVDYQALLQQALNEPGALSSAYRAFHNFSMLNQSLAYLQCQRRGLEISPLASFSAWKSKGRLVKKGEKAISLFLPVTKSDEKVMEHGNKEAVVNRFFILKPHWFVLSQTEGPDVEWPSLPNWQIDTAIPALEIEQIPFASLNGNAQGYAVGRSIAVNPLAAFPLKTTFHELAHVLLGHTVSGQLSDDEQTPRNLQEVEAESVAYIVSSILGLPGQDSSRAYIQGWLGGETLSDASIRKIFSCADRILKAGH